MTGWRSAAAAGAAGALLAIAPAPTATADEGTGAPLFTIQDRDITESSGLVDTGRVVYTVNDSGSTALLYALDPHTGEVVGTTAYTRDDVTDVEALAPGRHGRVWVADIGDNGRRRDSVVVYDVRPGRDRARRFELTYPDGPRDAETLLAHPRTGRLFVVSKTVFGGVVYAAPRRLDPVGRNRLRPFARVPGLVTDGTFLPGGEHVLLRGYATASVYTFPGFAPTGTVRLPDQEQGEGIAVGPDGRVLLSSEGIGSAVLETALPPRLTTPRDPVPSPGARRSHPVSPGGTPDRSAGVPAGGEPAESRGSGWRWAVLPAGAAAAGLGLLVRARRRRVRSP